MSNVWHKYKSIHINLCIFEAVLKKGRMFRVLVVICLVFLLVSCAERKTERQQAIVHSIESPAAMNSAQPYLFSGEATLLSWIENSSDSLYTLKYAELKNEQWDTAKTIATGANWFVNWADFPAIAEHNGMLMSHYLQMSAAGIYTYDIHMKLGDRSTDTWQDDFILHDDGTKSEHGFVTTIPYKEHSFFVTWLDGRNTVGGHDHGGSGAMTLRAAEITSAGEKLNETELDVKTCDCCQTSAAITQNGPIVVYRDRSDDEIRDIYITRKTNNVWSEPKAIYNDNWKISGCPVNGPKADAIDDLLAIAWYTGANELPKVNVIFSMDGGKNFGAPIIVDEVFTIGRVDIALISDNDAIVSWVTSNDSKTIIKAQKIMASGDKGKTVVVAELDPSRTSGFPQLEVVKDKAIFAWTAILNDNTYIKTATISLTDF